MKEKIINFITFITSDRKRLIVGVSLIVLVIGFLVTVFMYFSNSSNNATSQLPPDVEIPGVRSQSGAKKTTSATLDLVLKGNKKVFKVNDTITFTVVADTSGQIIRGYDAIFRYDDNMVSYVKSTNLDTSFDYQQRTRGNWIMITGAQKLNNAEKIVLKKGSLVELQFKALRPGVAHFPLSFVEGRLSDSNLVNEKSEDILTKVTGTTITITQ